MAITKVGAMTDPPVAGDYTILQAKLDAYAKQVGNQGMILTQWTNTTTAPKIAMGSYITHGGTLFVVDTEDYVITNPPESDGTFYLLVKADGDSLIGVWTSSLTGFSWNAIYNGLYDPSGDQILPYQLVKAGATLTKRKITNLMQGSGFVTVDWTGAMIGQTLSVASINATDVVTTSGPNKPVDNNDTSMPSVGIGGFSYATHTTSTAGVIPSITIGSGGTWVYVAQSGRSGAASTKVTNIGSVAGGSSVEGSVTPSGDSAYLYVIAWRIA